MKLPSISLEKCRPFQTFNTNASPERDGAMLPMLAVTIVILFVACAFAVDIARMHLTRSEIRTATDAAARAAVESLGRVRTTGGATDAAIAIAKRNVVAGSGLTITADNVRFGAAIRGTDGKYRFEESNTLINSVRVVGERTQDSPDGPVSLMFGPLLGTDTFSPVAASTAVRLDRDIALVLDKSGSMATGGRFGGLLNGVDVFLTALDRSIPEERVSLTVYATTPTKLVDMTDQMPDVSDAIARVVPGGLTGIGRALEVGIDSVQNDPGSRGISSLKAVVLMTDGRQNVGVDPVTVAQTAKALDIVVHTITFGNGANNNLMKEVADITGGLHVHARTNRQLSDAFATIAEQVQLLTVE